jgi:asparagine synthase (glutamine-hydrolysing)
MFLTAKKYVITKTLLGRMILSTAGDRADMANSLESRPPFLDHHLVEYVQNLPPCVTNIGSSLLRACLINFAAGL